MQYPSLRALCAWLLPCALLGGCAVSSVADDPSVAFSPEAGPSSSVTTTPPADDASVSSLPITADGGALSSVFDAGSATSDAGARDAGASDAGAKADASASTGGDAGAASDAGLTADAGAKADAGGGASCVASQCSITCFTAPCCNASNQCACQDLLGLCILPGL